MPITGIENAKKLKAYCRRLGREGVAKRIIEIAKEIVEQKGAYQSTLVNAGKIKALATGANEDSYWGEKAGHGFYLMVEEAEHQTRELKK